MISIQEVGKSILTGNPSSFYVFAGNEYGIKIKYLDILKSHYGNAVECDSVSAVLTLMKTKHIIPLTPALYIIRYDEVFLSELSDTIAQEIAGTNIIGTIVCIYEGQSASKKLDKYLPTYTVSIDEVSSKFVNKYLHSDFPKLADRFIDVAVRVCDNYGQARLMCNCMQFADTLKLYALSDFQIAKLFGRTSSTTDAQIRVGVASRNFAQLLNVLNSYEDDADSVMYTILSTMIDLDKLMDNEHTQSDIKEFVSKWSREDVYNMFMHTYSELSKLRTLSISDKSSSLVYLFGLLNFIRIPSLEVMI